MGEEVKQKKGINRWVVLAVLVLCFTLTFFNRFVWAPLMVSASQEIGMNMALAGGYMSAFYLGYLITQIPAGILADKFRVKIILFLAVVIGGVLTLSMYFVNSYESGYALRLLSGLIGGFIMACCSRVLSNYFEAKTRAMAFGFLMAAPPIGTLMANLIGPPLNAAMGWRNTFVVAGIISFVAAILVLVIIREAKKAPVAEGAVGAPKKTGMLDGLKAYFTNPQILILSVAGFLFMWVPPGTSTWGNTFMQQGLGYDQIQAGYVMTAYSVAAIIGSISSGFIGDYFKISKKLIIQVGYLLMAVFAFVFGMQTTFTGLMIVGIIFGYVSYLSSTHITTLAISYAGDKYAATTTSIQNLIFQIANVFMPIVCGGIVDSTGQFSGVWYLFTGLMIAAFIIVSFAKKDQRNLMENPAK